MSTLKPMSVLTVALALAAIAVLAPLWAPLVLAAWFADLLRPAVRAFERRLGGRRRAAALLLVLVTVAVLAPLAGLVAALAGSTLDFLSQLRTALEGQGSPAAVLLGDAAGTGAHPDLGNWAALASRYGANAWHAMTVIARASAAAVVGALVFVAALYTFCVDGERAWKWLETNAPIPRPALVRLAAAFRETGRGILVGGGGTALAQGLVATAAYVAIGIPRAFILGPLTAVCALVPFVGTGLVWIPLAIGLGARGEWWRLGVVVATGVGVHSLVDNFVRPWLTRFGRLKLPTFVVLVSMLGGIALIGATGALLGPLVARLCAESLAIESERRHADAPAS